MKHAKPSVSNAYKRVLLAAIAAVALIVSAFTVFNATASNQAAAPTQQVYGTSGSCAVNVNGDCTVNHGLGVKPTAVVVTPANGGQQATVDPAKTTSTSFTVRFLWRDGTRFKTGTVIKYNVIYTYVGVPVTTSPTPTQTTPTTTSPSPTPTSTLPAGACTNPTYTSTARENNGTGGYNNGGYHISNNIWNTDDPVGPQTLGVCNYHNWYVVSNQPGTGDNDSVKSYPDVQKNVNVSMSNVPDINTSWKINTPSTTGHFDGKGQQWNAAYDLWLNNFDSEIMVWTNWNANWKYWYDTYGGQEVTLDGVPYYVYHKAASGGNASGIWFVRKNGTNQESVNLKPLLDFAKSKSWVSTTDKLEYIEYGFEIMYTGAPTRFDVLDYSLNVGAVSTPTPTPTVTPTSTPTTTSAGYNCNPSGEIAHFYPTGGGQGEGSDAIGDAQLPEKWGQYNASAEQWAVYDDYLSNMCVYSKDNWYVDIKATNHGDGAVQSYPSMRKIYHDWGTQDFSNDPKLSSFPKLTATVAHTSPSDCTGCIYEEAFDIWLNGIGGDSPELMIWTHNQGQVPYGDLKASSLTLDGVVWDYYNSGTYMAFVPHDKTANLSGKTFDLKKYIAYVSSVVGTDPKLGQVSYGVEPVDTKGVFKRWTFSKFDIVDY